MRWFVVLLIVANVILFFWVQQQSRPTPGSIGSPLPEVGRLRLLHEIRAEEVASSGPTEIASAESESSSVGGAQTTAEGLDGAKKTNEEPPVVADADAMAATVKRPADDAVVPASGSAVRRITEGGAGRGDTRVTSAGVDGVRAVPETVAAAVPDGSTAAAAATQAADSACAKFGPFAKGDADGFLEKLPAHMELIADTREPYDHVDGYFVLIPPLPSTAEGVRKMKELADAGFKDTWLFQRGNLRNGISLGVYSNAAGAQRHAAYVNQKGFPEAKVSEKISRKDGRWLLLKNARGGDPADGLALPEGITATAQACP